MKILLSSHRFYPSVGGVESVGRILAEEFAEMGHQVCVVTQTPTAEEKPWLFPVVRCPSPWQLWRCLQWSDVYFQNNISLQFAWPLMLTRRPWIVLHHTWIARPDGTRAWQDQLKRRLLRFAKSWTVSRALADSLPGPSTIVPDPYDDLLFRPPAERVERRNDLIFVGRLVSDKGLDLLLEALAKLRLSGLSPRLTIVGDGPDRARWQKQAAADVAGQVSFVGEKTGEDLVSLLHQHQILVVPSRWEEPFGLVALEGIACGCAVIGSAGGGLPDAVGQCGVTFVRGDVADLTRRLEELLKDKEHLERFRAHAEEHLRPHRRAAVARLCLRLLEQVVRENPRAVAPAPGHSVMAGLAGSQRR